MLLGNRELTSFPIILFFFFETTTLEWLKLSCKSLYLEFSLPSSRTQLYTELLTHAHPGEANHKVVHNQIFHV